jgi:bacillithiol synthase
MQRTCVPPSGLPRTSALAAAASYEPDRVARFFQHPYRDLGSFKDAASELNYPDDRRASMMRVLRACNPPSAALERLAQPGVVAVVTGQQAGLFSGPAYTVYKALHAAKLAAWLSENGVPAVPVFWLATEDHDFAEVNHAWVFNSEHLPSKVETRRIASRQPVGNVTLAEPPVTELREKMEGLPFLDEALTLVESSYRPGTSMGAAFGSLLRETLAAFDILQVDPLAPEFREAAAPALASAVQAAPELTTAVLNRGRELAQAGFHAQVHVEEKTSFFFLLEGGKRIALRRHGDEYAAGGRRVSKAELMERAVSLSPNALLRPVIQDSVLPTVAYVGGPGEIAYLAQSHVIYQSLLGRMPVTVPRATFTLLDARSQRLLDRYGLELGDFFEGEQDLRQKIASSLTPPSLNGALNQASSEVDSALATLREAFSGFDVTLVSALDHSARKMRYQMGKLERKAGREAMARDRRAERDAASLYGLICPERHLQERLYSFIPFLAKHGLDLPSKVYEAIQLDCPDHQILVV